MNPQEIWTMESIFSVQDFIVLFSQLYVFSVFVQQISTWYIKVLLRLLSLSIRRVDGRTEKYINIGAQL